MSLFIAPFNVGRQFLSWTVASPSERLHSMATKGNKSYSIYIAYYRADKLIDSEITSNRCNHSWLFNRSLDGDTRQIQNGERSSDIAQYTVLALVVTAKHAELDQKAMASLFATVTSL